MYLIVKIFIKYQEERQKKMNYLNMQKYLIFINHAEIIMKKIIHFKSKNKPYR